MSVAANAGATLDMRSRCRDLARSLLPPLHDDNDNDNDDNDHDDNNDDDDDNDDSAREVSSLATPPSPPGSSDGGVSDRVVTDPRMIFARAKRAGLQRACFSDCSLFEKSQQWDSLGTRWGLACESLGTRLGLACVAWRTLPGTLAHGPRNGPARS